MHEILQSVDASLTWYETVVVAAAFVTAARLLWTKFFRPVLELLRQIDEFYPLLSTITEIAKEFKPDHGESLKDNILTINDNLEEIVEDLEEFKAEVFLDMKELKNNSIRTREGKGYNGE